MADSFDHCEALVRASDKDRFLSALFAPQKYRRALFALYAFNIEIGRMRELAREPMPGEIRLQWWRDALRGIGRGEVEANPVAAALRDVIVRYRLPPDALTALIDARTFDLYNEPMASLADLERYALQTSSAVLELAARILADGRDSGIGPLAAAGGMAYAFAGLLRALPIHSSRGQIYLPADLLQRYGAQEADVLAGSATTEVRAVLADLRLRARQHLAQAREFLGTMPAAVAPALLPVALVPPALARMERRGYQPFMPGEVPQWRRQWTLWCAARSNLRNAF
jgi:phytoene synthase